MTDQFWEREPPHCPDCEYHQRQIVERDAKIKRLRQLVKMLASGKCFDCGSKLEVSWCPESGDVEYDCTNVDCGIAGLETERRRR